MAGQGFETLKVLIVEDNHHMRALLRALLSSLNIRDVCEAGNGIAALELLRDHSCDLILTDLAMAPMDGLALAREIRSAPSSNNHFVPIIMITGHTEKRRVEAARDAGVTAFLAKPITPQNLFNRISEIVEHPRPFVRADRYFGPDRRHKTHDGYAGPWRRHDDLSDIAIK